MSKRIVLFGLIVVLAVVVGFVTMTPLQAVVAVKYWGMWFVAAAMLGLAWFGWRVWSQHRATGPVTERLSRRSSLIALAMVVGSAGFLHMHEAHAFKIVADEIVLSSTAMQMHKHREAAMMLRGHEFAGNFVPLNTRVDKRPLTFPFLLSLVHAVAGYRFENVFILNGALTLALTGLLFLLGRRLGGFGGGIVAVGWICTVPLVTQNATGAGFELLNMVMILLTIWLGMIYAEKPDDGDRLGAFLMAGILLAQVRYESALFVVPVGAVVLYGWWRLRRVFLPAALLATPILFLPVPWQHNVFKLSESTWQLQDIEGATSPFGLQYFYDNVGHAMNFFLSFDGTQPNAWMLGVLGPLAVGFLLLLIAKKFREVITSRPGEAAFQLAMVGLVLHALLMLCYFWGHWDDPVIRRLSLPTHLLLILAIVYIWAQIPVGRRRWWPMGVLIGAQLLGWSVPAMARQAYNAENFAARTVNWLQGYAEAATAAGRKVLAIDPAADMMWFLHDQASMNHYVLTKRTTQFAYHFRRHTFDDIYVVQRLEVDLQNGNKTVWDQHELGPGIALETIEEREFAPYYIIRISRVVGVDEALLEEWAEQHSADEPATASVFVPVNNDALEDWMRNLP